MNKLNIMASMLIMGVFSSLSVAQECVDQHNLLTASTKGFIIHNNGTATHLKTNLIWKRCLLGVNSVNGMCDSGTASKLNWQQALEAVEDLNANGGFAGYTDWRLPNTKELISVIEYGCAKPAMNLTVFPNMVGIRVWSSTASENVVFEEKVNLKTWFADYGASEVGNGTGSGMVSFANGDRSSQNYGVHLVRGAE